MLFLFFNFLTWFLIALAFLGQLCIVWAWVKTTWKIHNDILEKRFSLMLEQELGSNSSPLRISSSYSLLWHYFAITIKLSIASESLHVSFTLTYDDNWLAVSDITNIYFRKDEYQAWIQVSLPVMSASWAWHSECSTACTHSISSMCCYVLCSLHCPTELPKITPYPTRMNVSWTQPIY